MNYLEETFGRSLDSVYKGKDIVDTGNEHKPYMCTMCGKEYKQWSSAVKHLEKRNCHQAIDVFRDTYIEGLMLNVVDEIVDSSFPTIYWMRKSSTYRPLAQLTGFMISNIENAHFRIYTMFLKRKMVDPRKMWISVEAKVNTLCKIGQKESTLAEYREYLYRNQHKIHLTFYYTNEEIRQKKDYYCADIDKLIRGIERCDFSLSDAIKYFDLEDKIEDMTKAQKQRLDNICQIIDFYQEI